MTTQVTIRERFNLIDKQNPVSGHRWTEHGPTTCFYVIGACGISSRHNTIKGAEKAQQELQDFYNKFNL